MYLCNFNSYIYTVFDFVEIFKGHNGFSIKESNTNVCSLSKAHISPMLKAIQKHN